jgi:hypothetical protein
MKKSAARISDSRLRIGVLVFLGVLCGSETPFYHRGHRETTEKSNPVQAQTKLIIERHYLRRAS